MMRIEDYVQGNGKTVEVLRFIGGPTGHESYRLDEAFCAMLVDPDENRLRPRFYICAGTPGRYDACSVSVGDIEAYLREHRPHLFPNEAPIPISPRL